MKAWFLIIFATAALSGCGGGAPPDADQNVASNPATSPAIQTASNIENIKIESPDKAVLVGSYFESGKQSSPALLLLHQWQGDRHSYDDFARTMQAKGFNVLSFDGRGFGESTKTADGRPITPERTDAAVQAMLGDVDAAFTFLSKQKDVDPAKIGIVGASYGSSLALIYAADHPKVAAVALLSPGLNYFGHLPTEPAIRKYGDRKVLFIAASDDKESADAVRQLNPVGVDKPRYPEHIFGAGGHGTALLKAGADRDMSDFFAEVFDLANLHLNP